MPKQTVNSVILNWVKRGLAYLEMVPGTRNRKIICLTEEGKRFGENVVMKIYSAEQRSFGKMSKQERQSIIELLGKYITLLEGEIDEK